AVDQEEDRREDRQHRQEREEDRGPGDESEIADASELRDGQKVEGQGGREGTEQDAGAAARGGALERPEGSVEHTLFAVPEEEVDPVVGAEADDDRDE